MGVLHASGSVFISSIVICSFEIFPWVSSNSHWYWPNPTRAAPARFSVMHTSQWQCSESSFSGGFPMQNV